MLLVEGAKPGIHFSGLSGLGLITTLKESSFLSIPNCVKVSVRLRTLARNLRRYPALALRFMGYLVRARRH